MWVTTATSLRGLNWTPRELVGSELMAAVWRGRHPLLVA